MSQRVILMDQESSPTMLTSLCWPHRACLGRYLLESVLGAAFGRLDPEENPICISPAARGL